MARKPKPKPKSKTPAKPKLAYDPSFMDIAKGLTLRQLFDQRIRREGKFDAFNTRCEDLEKGQGLHREAAIAQAAREFGRLGTEQERRLYCIYLAEQATLQRKNVASDEYSIAKRNREDNSFEAAMMKLPNTAHPAVELDWIRAHPVMSRQDRTSSKANSVIMIGTDEILNAIHGIAPSKSAVNMLQHWCNRPDQFHQMMLTEQKKGAANKKPVASLGKRISDGMDGEPADDDMSELNGLLGGN